MTAAPHSAAEARLCALRRVRDRIDRDYAEPIALDDLARAAGCSRFHLVRSFADAFGETPGRFLTRRRIERAQELLRSVNLSVTEVCFAVGYSSLGSFSAQFKSVCGISPSAYQRASAARGGPPAIPGCFVLMWARTVEAGRRDPPRSPTTAIREKRARGPSATLGVERTESPTEEATP